MPVDRAQVELLAGQRAAHRRRGRHHGRDAPDRGRKARGIAQVPAHDLGLEPGRRIAAHQHTQRNAAGREPPRDPTAELSPGTTDEHHGHKPTRDVTVSPRHIHGRSPPVG